MNLDKASTYLGYGFTRLALELQPGRSQLKTGHIEWLLLTPRWILRHEQERSNSARILDLAHDSMALARNPSSHSCEVSQVRGGIQRVQMHMTQ